MNKRLKRYLLWVGGGIFIVILLVLAFLYQPAYAPSANMLSFVQSELARQKQVEADIQAGYLAGKYTFNSPMVIQDPYRTAPLTALVIFDTPEASQISVHVPGKSSLAEVDVVFPGYQQHHEIPIYGLYAGTLNRVRMGMKTQSGAEAQTEIDLQTEALPVSMENFTVDRVDPGRYSPGFNFTFLDDKQVFDLDGDVRWYSTAASFQVFTRLKNGHFLFTYSPVGSSQEERGCVVMEQDLLGKIYAVYNVADGINHDIYELPDGNLLITSSDLRSSTIEDYLIEVDRRTGHIVRSFDLKNYFDKNRPHDIDLPANDWFHLNSIVYDPVDRSIIISGRSQSAVIKMTYPGMQIKWILGPHDNWGPKYQPYLLTPVGTHFEWSWSQHHATLYEPDAPGSSINDILLFDDGPYRSFDQSTAYSAPESYSRVVHYRINEAAMTVEQVWEYGKERGSALFSSSLGSAYVLSNGDVLGTWGEIARDAKGNPLIDAVSSSDTTTAKIIEINPVTNEVVFESTETGGQLYRAMRAGFYDSYSDSNDSLSQKVNNTTENDLTDRSVMAWRDIKRWSDPALVLLTIKRWGRFILSMIKKLI